MNRRQNFQTIAWFNDLMNRELLNLNPPYQRRSVWTQSFKDFFIETILLNYPAPTIFLYEEISEDGQAMYNVVDGKQRLSSLFEFINNQYPVAEDSVVAELRGVYFSDLDRDRKNAFWSYTFSVEYLPTNDETIINNIFDRINRNVAKLTSQELRHAKFSGAFISESEDSAEWMIETLPNNFPQIAARSKSQMKDVELVAQILLRLETIPRGYSTIELDEEFSTRDDAWDNRNAISTLFRNHVNRINEILELDEENIIVRSRIKNQADFYSLIGVLHTIEGIENQQIFERLLLFVEHELTDNSPQRIQEYYNYARTASNRTAARKEREIILREIIQGEIL